MKTIDLGLGSIYSSQWSCADFYNDAEQKLSELLSNGENFKATGSSKKELSSFDIIKQDDKIIIIVNAWMDEFEDLIYNTIDDEEVDISEELEDEIIDLFISLDVVREVSNIKQISVNSTLKDIQDVLTELEKQGLQELEENFKVIKSVIQEQGFKVG